MSYSDRQNIITWLAPSGIEFKLQNITEINYSIKHYGNLHTIATQKDKNNNNLDFLSANSNQQNTYNAEIGDYFEDLGISGKTIPLKIIFNGNNHDLEADKFEKAFCEIGQSKLQLIYEKSILVNAQSLSKSYNIINDISSTIFDVEFIETSQLINSQNNETIATKKNKLKIKIDEQLIINAEATNNNVIAILNNSGNKTTTLQDLAKKYNDNLTIIVSYMQEVVDKFNTNVIKISNSLNNIKNNDFNAILRDIQANLLNNLDGNLSITGQQINKLINLGFSIVSSAPFNVSLLQKIINNLAKNEQTTKDNLIINDFFITTLFLCSCNNIVESDINTKKESYNVAVKLQNIYDDYKLYYDELYKKLNQTLENSFVNFISINNQIQQTTGFLIENSFNLKTEMILMLNEETNIIDLAYKYYKNSFLKNEIETLDYIIKTNNLKDEELILIPKNKKIRIYL